MDELTAALTKAIEDQKAGQDHADRGDDQPGTGRAVPPRRDEEAGRGGGHRPRRHAPAEGRMTQRSSTLVWGRGPHWPWCFSSRPLCAAIRALAFPRLWSLRVAFS